MKKIGVFLLLAMLVLSVGVVAAQPSSYTTCYQVQNLDSSNAANVVMSYYEQGNGTPVATPSDTIAAGSSTTYCPLDAVSSGFNGSVVISSDRQVSAIANVSGNASFSAYNASYTGFDAGATTVSLPLLFANNYGYNTWFNVQNTGTSDATVNVSYSDGTTVGPVTIGVGQSYTFDQATETHNSAVFAGTITSTGAPVVATVLEVGPSSAPMLFGYNGFTAGSVDPVMPLVQSNNYGYTTGIQVQNTGGTATDVVISYTPSTSGTACTDSATIQPGASATFGLTGSCIESQTFVGSAQVTSNSAGMDLVAIVNQQNFSLNKGASYGAFNTSDGTENIVMPLIMDRNYGYFTGYNVVNVGVSSVTVDCTYSNSAITDSATVAPGAAATFVQFNNISNGYVGSATCTATGGSIIGVVNQTLTTGTQDTFLTYEATNN